MSKPLTEEQTRILSTSGEGRTHNQWRAGQAALARIAFLERKLVAADRLVNMDIVRGVAADQCAAYDEVSE